MAGIVQPLGVSSPPRLWAILATPALVLFVSSNLVNAGNLAFNMIFSRLMGPELFGVLALLLTIKLALLGVLGAAQLAVSQLVAATPGAEGPCTEQALSRINRRVFIGLISVIPPLTAGLMLAHSVDARPGQLAPHLLLILLAALPFGGALSLLRGVAFGRLRTRRIILSANVEMAVRLAGAILAWQAGFGIAGVVGAISLSIVAGWLVLSDLLPRPARAAPPVAAIARTIAIGAAPFGVLQLAQVLALDGDIFLAQILLPAHEAGYIAALSLFQRIQFFACFALAGVLLPSVVSAVRDQRPILPAILPVAALFGAVTLPLVLLVALWPEPMIALLVGPAYLTAAPGLWLAALAAAAFTLSYLLATLLIALGDRTGVAIALAGALMQLALMALSGPTGFADFLGIKLGCQIGVTLLLLIRAVRRGRRITLGLPL